MLIIIYTIMIILWIIISLFMLHNFIFEKNSLKTNRLINDFKIY